MVKAIKKMVKQAFIIANLRKSMSLIFLSRSPTDILSGGYGGGMAVHLKPELAT
jgi:hypothetical protein